MQVHVQGPYLQLQRTHLQRILGDDNVLLVKFTDEMSGEKGSYCSFQISNSVYHKVAEEGIFVGLRWYQFFGKVIFFKSLCHNSLLQLNVCD